MFNQDVYENEEKLIKTPKNEKVRHVFGAEYAREGEREGRSQT